MIDDAERRGAIRPGDTIMEPTSGNTGISLAMICRVRGYKLVAVMPENVTAERRQLLTLYGAEIVSTDGEFGSNGAVEVAKRLAAENGLFMPFQYGNPANPRAHYEGTAEEIVRDCPEIDVFVAGLGTGGTLMGSSQRLKEHRPEIQVIACEPLQGDPVSGLRSLDDGFVPPILDLSRLDRKLLVANRDAPGHDPPARGRGGHLRRGLLRRGHPHLRARGAEDDPRHHRRHRLRRGLEVPAPRASGPTTSTGSRTRSTTGSSGSRPEDPRGNGAGARRSRDRRPPQRVLRDDRRRGRPGDAASSGRPTARAARSCTSWTRASSCGSWRRSTTPAQDLLAIYHSHTRSAAYPSRTDVELAFFPDTLYLIVSIADRDAPEIRAFRLSRTAPEGEQIAEEPVEIL